MLKLASLAAAPTTTSEVGTRDDSRRLRTDAGVRPGQGRRERTPADRVRGGQADQGRVRRPVRARADVADTGAAAGTDRRPARCRLRGAAAVSGAVRHAAADERARGRLARLRDRPALLLVPRGDPGGRARPHGAPPDPADRRGRRRDGPGRPRPRLDRHRADRAPGRRRLDRKSTRLNSSHVRISYAVFCLKKKKKTQINNQHYNKNTKKNENRA